ncbi:cbb3-type cytochrome c oxidase subunit 3 [Salinisphaera sp. PC39]|uniref:cbb3-type cytochrome oxidase subunit 3 n=1 Tax=Salinisphaera sp. PC39 TaxID=1304156 RepID=UPI00333F3884
MDLGTLMGLVTLVFLVIFVGIVFWAYSGRRRKDFDEASRLPLDEGERGDDNDSRRGTRQ